MPKSVQGGKDGQATVAAPPAAKAGMKKRNSNPGVRQQGGRIYDSENGTTCHQCRQKTVEVKARCTACTFHFCPRCLENRYSEVVAEVNALPAWACPRCRGACNCSNCRKKAGLGATGILAGVAKSAGFGSVSDLLARNPAAQALGMMAKGAAATAIPSAAPDPARPPAAPRPKRKAAEGHELVDDAELGPRPAPMPPKHPLALHAAAAAAGGASAKRQRGPAWLDRRPLAPALPPGVDASELACVLEFVAAFGEAALGLRRPSLRALAAELTQPAAPRRADQLCPVPEDSVAAALHQRLLEVVRHAWGCQGAVGLAAWQCLMRAYYAAYRATPEERREAREAQGEHQPAAVAGEVVRRARPVGAGGGGEDAAGAGGERAGAGPALVVAAALVQYPPGGYWGLDPGARVSMLYALVHDALDVHAVRAVIDGGVGGAAAGGKERRAEAAAARRAAREAAARQRDREIALIIAGGGAKAMTLEQQRTVLAEARERAEAAAAAAAAAGAVDALPGAVPPPTVRVAPLGQDRDGGVYYSLSAAAVLTGREHGLVVLMPGCEEGSAGTAHAVRDTAALARALDPRGRNEGRLRRAAVAACKLPPAALEAPAAVDAAEAQPALPGGCKRKRRSPEVDNDISPASPLPSELKKARQGSDGEPAPAAAAELGASPPRSAASRRRGRALMAADQA